jgi:hypothetical protein
MAPVEKTAPASGSNELDPERSPQIRFATLQLDLSQAAKESAMAYLEEVEKVQEEQTLVSTLYQEARQSQADAKSSGKATAMSADMVNYMSANKLAYDKTGNDTSHDKDQWETAITSLKAVTDRLGTDTQQKMVFVTDSMGQYNSYLQGASSAVQQSNQTLRELAHTS